MKKILIGLCLMFALTSNVWAFTVTPTGTQVVVEYTEPTTNADGTPLVDLGKVKLYWVAVGTTVPAVVTDFPATKATGGGTVSQILIIPIAINKEADIEIWGTASDRSGNESIQSIKVVVRIDRLAPGGLK